MRSRGICFGHRPFAQVMAAAGRALAEMRRANSQSQPATPRAVRTCWTFCSALTLENSLAEGLLKKADRASMRYAIELRPISGMWT